MLKVRLWSLFLFISLTHIQLNAQGVINTQQNICLGSISNYSYTPPSGLTVSSLSWNFGDGGSSSVLTPTHTYSALGKYTVKVQAVFTNSSSTADSLLVEVFGLPKPFFYFLPESDTCFNDNIVCFKDTSSPAKNGQNITSRLMVWGDGTYQTYSLPKKGDSICHTYPVSANYSLRMELTDNKGCKNSVNGSVNVVENITVNFSIKDTFVDCVTGQVFMKNFSFGAGPSTSHYRWYLDTVLIDTGFYFSNFKRINFNKTTSGKITLIAYANNMCRDTLTKNFTVIVDSLPLDITLSDTLLCNSDQFSIDASIKKIAADSICWYFDGLHPPPPIPQLFDWHYIIYHKGIGPHEIMVKLFRGSCIYTLKRNIFLKVLPLLLY